MNVVRFLTLMVAVLFAGPRLFAVQESKATIRFEAVDIYVDSGKEWLAAYQLEFWVRNGNAKIVGIEGGSHPAFEQPPFYDPKAIQKERVIIASFNTGRAEKLPIGKTRVATIHLQVSGTSEPRFDIKLHTAANPTGKKISAKTTFERKQK